jgi:two-component system, LytTR family, sensor kinase
MQKRATLQLLFWLVMAGINMGFTVYFLPLNLSILATGYVLLFQAFVFYVNTMVLFPRYFSLSRTGRYLLVMTLFILFVALCQTLVDYCYFSKLFMKPFPRFKPNPIMIITRYGSQLVFIGAISTVFMMQDRIRQQTEQTQKIKAEKLATELKLLKAQINPHFIFNTLNNIYSLVYLKSDRAAESVLKLSQMLRYVIEECEREKVALKSEIEYIENYIAFRQIKSPGERKIAFDCSAADPEVLIAPMLFMPFIENGFKYSEIEETPEAFVSITLGTDSREIRFNIRNSIPSPRKHRPGAGTGIENVRKRLEILFPQRHTLRLLEGKNEFDVHLTLWLR